MRGQPQTAPRRAPPSISVVVPAHNAEPYIAHTLEAILSQTVAPAEVIVVDDGSTDATLDEIARVGGDITVVSQRNRGVSGACNSGFRLATGDYIARCDADDIWAPTKLERQTAALVTHPEVDIAFAAARVFGDLEQPFIEFAGAASPPTGVISDRRSFARSLYRANMICTSSAVIRRELQIRLGLLHGRHSEDYEYWLRAARANALFFYDPTVLVHYREHGGGLSANYVAMYEATYRLHRRYQDLAGGPVLVRRAIGADRFQTTLALSRLGKTHEARRALLAAIRHWPTAQRLAWVGVLAVPERWRPALVRSLRSAKWRALHRGRTPAARQGSQVAG